MRVFKRGHLRYLDKLSEYLDDRLDAEERARIEGHLEGCDQCRQELESLRETIGLLRRVALVEPPRSFKLQEAPSPRPGHRSLGGLYPVPPEPGVRPSLGPCSCLQP
ncbi:MAG: zf-HC2 domain-containing protein [Chloroflexi bacterium]|nr:zf-HC2 domain-containing protein [Chloroflexota bacterium]